MFTDKLWAKYLKKELSENHKALIKSKLIMFSCWIKLKEGTGLMATGAGAEIFALPQISSFNKTQEGGSIKYYDFTWKVIQIV